MNLLNNKQTYEFDFRTTTGHTTYIIFLNNRYLYYKVCKPRIEHAYLGTTCLEI